MAANSPTINDAPQLLRCSRQMSKQPAPRRTRTRSSLQSKRESKSQHHSLLQNDKQRAAYHSFEQYEQALADRDHRIQSLEEENRALKEKLQGKHLCSLCGRSYNRSDGLYKHLKDGDDAHKVLAHKRYATTCETCGKECKRWGDLRKHMAVHEQAGLKSRETPNLEPDETRSATSSIRENLQLVEKPMSNSSLSTHLKAQGFGNNPTEDLPIPTPIHVDSSFYDDDSAPMIAQSFRNNPTRGPPISIHRYADVSPHNGNIVSMTAQNFETDSLYDSDSIPMVAQSFGNDPTRGASIPTPGHPDSSHYDGNSTLMVAQSFGNNPLRGPAVLFQSHTDPSPYDGNSTLMLAQSFGNNPIRGPAVSFHSHTDPSPYDDNPALMVAQSFGNNPIRGPPIPAVGSTHSFWNDQTGKASESLSYYTDPSLSALRREVR